MQELSCAPRVILVAGKSTLDWDIVAEFLGDTPYSDAFYLAWSHGSLMRATAYTFERTKLIHHQRCIFRYVAEGKCKGTLMDVLARFKFGAATYPRDKIVGLLGLVSEEHNIHVDYNKTVGQLFAEVCKHFIETSGNLDIICQNPWQATDYNKDANGNINELPTWVADFTMKDYSGIDDRVSALMFAQRGIFSCGPETCVKFLVESQKVGMHCRRKLCSLATSRTSCNRTTMRRKRDQLGGDIGQKWQRP